MKLSRHWWGNFGVERSVLVTRSICQHFQKVLSHNPAAGRGLWEICSGEASFGETVSSRCWGTFGDLDWRM